MPRWTRIEELTAAEEKNLEELVAKTSGMTRFGNRVRIALLLPPHVAEEIARLMDRKGHTASTVCAELLAELLELEPA